MKLTCPECKTSYHVPDNAIGDDGRTVRCKNCKHQWFEAGKPSAVKVTETTQEETLRAKQEEETFADALSELNDDDDDIDFEALAIDPMAGAALPARSRPASSKSWMVASVLMALMVGAAFMLQARSSLYGSIPQLYHAIGYYPNDGVVLANVSIEKLDSRRKKRFKINCALLNTSNVPQIHPPIAMRIVSSGGNILAQDDAYVKSENRMIEAGQHVDCGDIEIVHNFASADKILLEIASPLEMGLRDAWAPN